MPNENGDDEINRIHNCLVTTIDTLKTTGTRIWIMKQIPQQPWNVPQALAHAVFVGHNLAVPIGINDLSPSRDRLTVGKHDRRA